MQYSAFKVSKGAAVPLSGQLADHFRKMILEGKLASGVALPSADSIRNASRLTALQAYRMLQSEGIVRMKPHHGTIVTFRGTSGFFGLVANESLLCNAGGPYLNQLVSAILRKGIFNSSPVKTYILNLPEYSSSPIDPWIPDNLRSDVQEGLLRGAFTFSPHAFPGLNAWLAARNVPCVSAGAFSPSSPLEYRVDSDRDQMFKALLKHPKVARGGAIEVWSPKDMPAFLEGNRKVEFSWKKLGISETNASGLGREAASSIASAPSSGGRIIFFEDDWLAISAILELRRLGLRVPEDVYVIAMTNSGMTEQMLQDCDCYVLDVASLGALMVDTLLKAASGAASSEKTGKIKYYFRKGRGTNG